MAAWLGLFLLPPSLALSVLVFVSGGGDHGGGAFALGGVGLAALFIAGARLIIWLERREARWTRALGGCALLVGAYFTAFYPYSWLRDSYSIPLPIALVGAVLTVAGLLAAWTLLKGA